MWSSLDWYYHLFMITLLYDFFHEADHVVLLSWCYHYFLYASWIWPKLDFDHRALLNLGLKWEPFFLAVDIEADFSGSNIDLCPRSA